MPRSWEDIIKERQGKAKAKDKSDPYLGDHTAKSRGIPLADERWQQVLVKRGADPYGYLNPNEKKEYNRPFYNPTLTRDENDFLQSAYDRSVNPIDRIATNDHMRETLMNMSKPQTVKKPRPMENATISNIPKVTKEVPRAAADQIKNISSMDMLNQRDKLFGITGASKEAPKALADQIKNVSALDMLNEREKLLQAKMGVNTPTYGNTQKGYDPKTFNPNDYPQSDFLPTSPDVKFKNEVKKKGLSFVAGLTSPITKLGMTLDTYFSKDPKTGLYPEDGSKWRSVSNWYTLNEDKLLEQGLTKKQIKEARKQELAMAKQEDDYNLLNASMDKPRRYQQTTGDQVANMTGSVVGSVAQAILTGNAVGAAAPGMNPIAQAAATGGITEAISSFSDRDSLDRAAKDIARNALFYGAGKYGSDKVGQVADQLMWKYGLQNNVALEYAKEALKGLGFDAAGYAATLPTYPMFGDQAPTTKEVAMDMAIGALFDAIPNFTITHAMVKDNKARMDYSMNNLKQTYENIAKYKQARPYDTEGINQMYDVLMDNITMTRDVINNTKIVGQDPNIAKLNSLFDQTEAAIQMTKNMQNTRLQGNEAAASNVRENMGALPFNPGQAAASQQQQPIVPNNPLYPKTQGQFKVNPNETMNQVLDAYRADQEARSYWGNNVPEWDGVVNPYETNPKINQSTLGSMYELEQPKAPTQAAAPTYGRNGKKAYTKWANNEAIMANLEDPNNPYTQMYNTVFDKWYEAGRLGLEQQKVPFAEIDAEFPPYIVDAIFQAGRNDMGKDTEIQTDPDTAFGNKVNEYVQKRLEKKKTSQPLSTLEQDQPGTRVYFKDPNKYYEPTTGTIEGVTPDGQVQVKVKDKIFEVPTQYLQRNERDTMFPQTRQVPGVEEKAAAPNDKPKYGPKGSKVQMDNQDKLKAYYDGVMGKAFESSNYPSLDPGTSQKLHETGVADFDYLEHPYQGTIYNTLGKQGQLKRLEAINIGPTTNIYKNTLAEYENLKQAYEQLDPTQFTFKIPEAKPKAQAKPEEDPTYVPSERKATKEQTQSTLDRALTSIRLESYNNKLFQSYAKAGDFSGAINELKGMIFKHKKRLLKNRFYSPKPIQNQIEQYFADHSKEIENEILSMYGIKEPTEGYGERLAPGENNKIYTAEAFAEKFEDELLTKISKKRKVTSALSKGNMQQVRYEINELLLNTFFERANPLVYKDIGERLSITGWVRENKERLIGKVFDLLEAKDPGKVDPDQTPEGYQQVQNGDPVQVGEKLLKYDKDFNLEEVEVMSVSDYMGSTELIIKTADGNTYSLYPKVEKTYRKIQANQVNNDDEWLNSMGFDEPQAQTSPGKEVSATEYEAQTKELLGSHQKEVYNYLNNLKNGRKSAVYYMSPELAGVDGLQKLSSFIRFTDNPGDNKLDVLQMEMSHTIPGIEEMGLEEFGQYLVDAVTYNRENTKAIKDLPQVRFEKDTEGNLIPMLNSKMSLVESYNELKEPLINLIINNKQTEFTLNRDVAPHIKSAAIYMSANDLLKSFKYLNKGYITNDDTTRDKNDSSSIEANNLIDEALVRMDLQPLDKTRFLEEVNTLKAAIVDQLASQADIQKIISKNKQSFALIKLEPYIEKAIKNLVKENKQKYLPNTIDTLNDINQIGAISKMIVERVQGNEPVNEIRNNGEGTLEEVQTENVQGTTKEGDLVQEPVRSAGENERGNGGSTRPGNELRPGVGDHQGEVHTFTRREVEASKEKVKAEAEVKKAQTLETSKGKNFVIKQDLDLSKNEQGRFEDNIAAIRLVRQLEHEKRFATPKEQEILAKYVGWGGLSKYFERQSYNEKQFTELLSVLSKEEYAAARGTVLTAFYTPINVIQSIYEVLGKLGFKGGRILEPGAGVGNFIGAAPTKLKNMNWTAIELDKITGSIAKYLYPNAHIEVNGYEKALIPDNFYDLAIGNVPFGDFGVNDTNYPKAVTSRIHNYFFAKSLDKVRPGGVVAFITSTGTLDSKNTAVRTFLSKQADLIGAVRLPNNTFKSYAGTNVVADLLIFKKREPGTPYAGEPFIETEETKLSINANYSTNKDINTYFKKHPEMVLGDMILTSSRHGGYVVDVRPKAGEVLTDQIIKAFSNIKVKMDYPVKSAKATQEAIKHEIIPSNGTVKENAYTFENGALYRKEKGMLVPIEMDKAGIERVKGLMGVRDAARALLKTQLENKPEKVKEAARKQLNKIYDTFVKKNGPITGQGNRRAFIDDPDYPFLLALEKSFNPKTKTAEKADLFFKDTIMPVKEITHVETSKEALVVSLNESGHVNLERMAQLTDKSVEELTNELISDNLIFKQTDGSFEIAERYLSGNVRVKLEQAEAMAKIDPSYTPNVEALKAVQPRDLTVAEIRPQIGQVWIPNEVYNQFAAHLFGRRVSDFDIQYIKQTGNFAVKYTGYQNIKVSPEALTKWGTSKKDGWTILDAALNNKDVKCTTKDEDGRTVVLAKETALAKEKLEAVKEEFKTWIFSDANRAETLASLYNYTQNNIALPKYDGSHLVINGMNPTKQLRAHQKNAVWRIISSGGNTLLAHKVGAGKSGEMAAAAMALRQMGIVKKPMFVVPNHLVEQWGEEFLSFFPGANILVAGKKDFQKDRRKLLMNKIATGDYDAVIVGESSFKSISMSESNIQEFYAQQLLELEEAMQLAKENGLRRNDPTVKQLEAAKKKLELKLEKKSNKIQSDKDNTPFEELGVDSLFIDEAHRFKNLMYTTNMNNVSGLGNKEGSDRAFDLYMKVRYLQKLNGGKGVVFATATPVMNSMSEMYIMQKYLTSDLLEQRGLLNFDAWAKQFGEVVTVMEMTPEGKGYRQKQSFSKFKNVGELIQLFRSFADILTEIEGLKIPNMKENKPIIVSCEPTQFQVDYINNLAERAEAIRGRKVDPTEDNMLKVTSDGRKLALDQRMIDPTAIDDPGSKVNQVVENVVEVYKRTKANKSAQLIFCDLSTPKGQDTKQETESDESNENISLYDEMKNKFILKGVKANEIAFIHEAKTDAQKLELFSKVNNGDIRILLGSTEKMGVGMNAQKKLIALHHMDPPWRPGDVEQRDGRILRQGNENPEVEIYHYVTKRTFDARMWDNLYRKAAFINTAMNATIDMRDMEDIGEFAVSAAEIKAVASDNPIMLEQFEVEVNLRKLYMSQQAFDNELIEAKTRLARLRTRSKVLEEGIIKLKADLKQRKDVSGDNFAMVINKKTYDKREDAGQALIELYRKNTPKEDKVIGSFAGFDLYLTPTAEVYVKGEGTYSTKLNAESASGTIQSLESRVRSMDRLLEGHQEELQEVKRNIPELEKASNAVFPKEAELKQLAKRFDEICKELGITDESSDTVEGAVNAEDEEADGSSAFTSVNGGPQLGAATGRNTDVKGTKRASEIYKEFAKAYDVAIKSRPSKGTLGTYDAKTHLIKIKKANDIPVLCHETGHLIDKYYQFSKNHKAPYAKELERLGEPTSRKSYSTFKKRREGVAEFLRLYWTDTEEAKKSSFYKPFIKAIRTEELEVIESLREEIWKLTNLAPDERIGKTIKFYDEKEKKETTPFETFFRKAYTELVDDNYPVEWAAGQLGGKKSKEAMKHMLSKMRGYEGIAMFDIDAKKEGGYQVDLKGNPVGPSYQSIVGELHKDKKLREDFLKYQVARRGLDYFKRGLEFPETKEVCEETIRILEIKHPEFKETFKQLLQYRKNNLKLLVQSGLITQKTYDKIMEDNPNYTPLKRDVDNYRYGVGDSRKLGASKHVIHKLKGGGQDIIDPEVNDINNTFLYRSAAMRNEILVKLAKIADSSEDMGWLMSKANINMKMFEISQEQINTIVKQALEQLKIPIEDMDFDVMNRIFKPNYAAGPNQVVIYIDGEPKMYDVAPELYKTLASLNANQANVLVDTLATIGKVAKTGIIFTPQYIYRNLARDTFQNLIGTRAGINPLDIVGGFISAIRKDKWYQLAQKQGGTTNYFTASDRQYAKDTIKEIVANQKAATRLLYKIKHPLNTIQDMIEPTEMAGRIAEMKKTLKKHGNKESAINEAIYNARDLSVDFKKAGALIKKLQLNRMINFFNAQIQGEIKDISLLANKKTALEAVLRSLLYLTAPTLMLWWINKDNENYQELPSYRRDYFFNIPIGDPSNTQLFFLVPRPFGLGTLFAALPERLMEKAYRDNPRAFNGFGETLEQAWGVPLMPSALTPIYELETNKDWRDIPILNQGDQQLKPYLQYNQYSSETSKKIASITKEIPGMPEMLQSPKQIDHLIKGYTGTLGSMALDTVDLMTGKKDRTPLSTIGSSFVADASKRPETINLFYEYKRKLDLDHVEFKVTQQVPKGYKPYVRELFTRISTELTNIKERMEKIEALPESKQKEEMLQKLRDEEIALMKGATRIYEKEYYK